MNNIQHISFIFNNYFLKLFIMKVDEYYYIYRIIHSCILNEIHEFYKIRTLHDNVMLLNLIFYIYGPHCY